MPNDLQATLFHPMTIDFGANDFVARIPADLGSRGKLFEALRQELKLPTYFGDNWDALADCLRDLSWLGQRRVYIIHADLPRLPRDDLANYIDLLAACVSDWKADDDHELVVVFPDAARHEIEGAVRNNGAADGQAAERG